MISSEYIIEYLQGIQDNLIGILIPSILSVVVSIITLIVNSILQCNLSNRQYKSKQYEFMHKHYPKIKSILVYISASLQSVENSSLYKAKKLSDYLGYDWEERRSTLTIEQTQQIDDFESNIKNIIGKYIDLNVFFENNNLPATSRRFQKAINKLQSYCVLINKNKNKRTDTFSYNYSKRDIDKLIVILDKNYNKF